MCELAFADLERVTVSRVEALLPIPSRTLQTVRALHDEEPGAELRLVVGSDVLGDTSKWHAFEDIRRLAPLFVVARQGHPVDAERESACALPAVSSTQVRTLLDTRSDTASRRALEELVPAAVLEYVERYSLYAGGLARQDPTTE
jgi:nicotinate-nucleotide adenylyltransferase